MPKFQTTLLFDLDGTLIDSTPAILDGFHYAFAHLGAVDPSDEAIKRLIGHPLEVMFERLGAAQDVQDFVLAYKQRYAQTFLDQTVLLSGAYEVVREASEFANLGVVTTKTSKFSKILLQHLGIAEFFGTIVGREDVKNPKPSAEPILKALENLGICSRISGENFSKIPSQNLNENSGKNSAEISSKNFSKARAVNLDEARNFCEVFMIGDTQLDALAAKSAAVRSVGVCCGYGSAVELEACCEFVCEDTKEAVKLIREALKRV